MQDIELQNIINKLREYTSGMRQSDFSRNAIFFLGVIDIVCCLTELGLYEPRAITETEEHWFKGSYHLNFWDSEIETNFYTPLVEEVRNRNFFRTENQKFL